MNMETEKRIFRNEKYRALGMGGRRKAAMRGFIREMRKAISKELRY
jgi:hypothetical protein